MQKYLKTKELHFGSKTFKLPSEALSYGIGLFGIALLSGWVPEYAKTYFADFAFKNQNFSSDALATLISTVFLVAGFVGAAAEIIIGFLVDKTKSKRGKIHPWLLYGCVPLGIISMLVFVAPKTSNFAVATIWMFAIYCAYVMLLVCVESPGNCFGAVCTPNPDERSDAISIAGIMRSIGQSGGMVVLIVVGLVMKAIMGKEGFQAAEGRGLDLQISTAVCVIGFILFLAIMLKNTRERVPYTTEKVNLGQSLKFVFTNKNLLMVSLAKLAGFGRGVYGAASLYIAIYLLGDKGLKLALLLPMGIGTAVSMLVVKKLIKTIGTKNTFIACSAYGVDEIELKTGKRQEGLCYAGYGLFSKIASAFTTSLGTYLVFKWSGYLPSTDPSVAYAAQSDGTLTRFLIIYTIIPACFVILQIIPMLFYDLNAKRKEQISLELIKRRGVVEIDE